MAERKRRAPGGGRKPQGDKAKTATINARIGEDTRKALDREARKRGSSLSQEIDERLQKSLKDNARKQLRALAYLMQRLATDLEWFTGEKWNSSAFTGQALRAGADRLLAHFALPGSVKVPKEIEARIGDDPVLGPRRKFFRQPDALGRMLADNIIFEIEGSPRPYDQRGLWEVRHDLGSSWERNQRLGIFPGLIEKGKKR